MSWKEATTVAQRIYDDLRAQHDPGFVRMVIRALTRILNRAEKKQEATEQK
jgi:hypothetical protein